MTIDKSGVVFGERFGGFVVVLFRAFGMGMRENSMMRSHARRGRAAVRRRSNFVARCCKAGNLSKSESS